MKGFGIYIQNDLLEPKHIEAMGIAVWLYMWLLDKMTSIDEKQVGHVLGNKPIKYEEIQEALGISADTYTRWMQTLEEAGYIKAIRTPAGISFRVFKAKKRFRKSAEGDSAQMRNRFRTNAESNIRQYKDNTVDPAEPPAPPVFSYSEYLEKMQKDKQPSIRFIAFFLKKKNLTFDSEAQVRIAIKRHLRAANDVIKFGSPKVNAAVKECERMKDEKGIEWTIETILKVLTK